MKLKIGFTFFIMLLLVSISSVSYAATPVTFTQGGGNYIYSNCPEAITSTLAGRYYTIDQSLTANIAYQGFFYHGNWASPTMKVGIAIKNENSTTQYVVIRSKALSNQFKGSLDEPSLTSKNYQVGLDTTADDYYVYINPGQTAIIGSINIANSYYSQGQIHFTPSANNMKARVFWQTSTDNTSPFDSSFSRAPGEDPIYARSTGLFTKDVRYANISYPTTNSFYLSYVGGSWQTYNPNEYQAASSGYLGSQYIGGNYGIKYDLTVQNAAGRTLRIYPYLPDANAKGKIVLWTTSNGWYTTPQLTQASSPQYWQMAVPSDGKIKFILPGGNHGSVRFDIL